MPLSPIFFLEHFADDDNKDPIYTSHSSRVGRNSSPRLAEVALNQRNAHTNSKVEHVASMVCCNVVDSSNTSETLRLEFDATEMRLINWALEKIYFEVCAHIVP